MPEERSQQLRHAAAEALDLVVALAPPEYGGDRTERRRRVASILLLLEGLRRQRKVRPAVPLPSKQAIEQLEELSGRQFHRRREEVVEALAKFSEQLAAAARQAPEELRQALREIAHEREAAEILRRDADEAWRSFHSGAFKAAVVMAGAALEGLLQQACLRCGERALSARRTLLRGGGREKAPSAWTIEEGLDVLRGLGLLSSPVAHVARGMKELRNYIHPDLQRRQRAKVGASHALLVLQALCTLAEELQHGLAREG